MYWESIWLAKDSFDYGAGSTVCISKTRRRARRMAADALVRFRLYFIVMVSIVSQVVDFSFPSLWSEKTYNMISSCMSLVSPRGSSMHCFILQLWVKTLCRCQLEPLGYQGGFALLYLYFLCANLICSVMKVRYWSPTFLLCLSYMSLNTINIHSQQLDAPTLGICIFTIVTSSCWILYNHITSFVVSCNSFCP